MPQRHPADKIELIEFYREDLEKIKKLWFDNFKKKR